MYMPQRLKINITGYTYVHSMFHLKKTVKIQNFHLVGLYNKGVVFYQTHFVKEVCTEGYIQSILKSHIHTCTLFQRIILIQNVEIISPQTFDNDIKKNMIIIKIHKIIIKIHKIGLNNSFSGKQGNLSVRHLCVHYLF